MPQVTINNEEAETYFHSALCNGGLSDLPGYGLQLHYEPQHYKEAKISLKAKTHDAVCYEDVLLEILKMGNPLSIKDIEGEGEYDSDISLTDLHERMQLVPVNSILQMVNGEDDAITADVIMQTVFFKEIIF
jgi:hypothetical protein